jgi:hypothetical protein
MKWNSFLVTFGYRFEPPKSRTDQRSIQNRRPDLGPAIHGGNAKMKQASKARIMGCSN